jgi:hypothetical protein
LLQWWAPMDKAFILSVISGDQNSHCAWRRPVILMVVMALKICILPFGHQILDRLFKWNPFLLNVIVIHDRWNLVTPTQSPNSRSPFCFRVEGTKTKILTNYPTPSYTGCLIILLPFTFNL